MPMFPKMEEMVGPQCEYGDVASVARSPANGLTVEDVSVGSVRGLHMRLHSAGNMDLPPPSGICKLNLVKETPPQGDLVKLSGH